MRIGSVTKQTDPQGGHLKKYSVTEIPRGVRRRLKRVVQKSADKDYARRALAVLHLCDNGNGVAAAAVRAARSRVHEWRSLYEAYGEDGVRPGAARPLGVENQ